jgi:hypothetical protein
MSSLLGMGGAVYQLWPKKSRVPPRGRREIAAFKRQNSIICFLAFADFLAAFGEYVYALVGLGGRTEDDTIEAVYLVMI